MPRKDSEYWLKRWRTVERLYKWRPLVAEAAHLVSLDHQPTSSLFSPEWLLGHNKAGLPDPSQCALCQEGLDTAAHRIYECPLVASHWDLWSPQEIMSGSLEISRAKFHAAAVSAIQNLHHARRRIPFHGDPSETAITIRSAFVGSHSR
ncbi:hypothetical protein V1514DRAFT_319064 [Lipomyces japonicus]|uniref:uncharacterized protein n=1 Tax=Lipomyces japonicus TaxID=56871 RepID=UPI0034CDDB43